MHAPPRCCRWSWAICTDTCAICRNNLYEPSIEYQANPTGDPDHPGLSIAWGCCGHVFHLDCIQVRTPRRRRRGCMLHAAPRWSVTCLRTPALRSGRAAQRSVAAHMPLCRACTSPYPLTALAEDALGVPALQQGALGSLVPGRACVAAGAGGKSGAGQRGRAGGQAAAAGEAGVGRHQAKAALSPQPRMQRLDVCLHLLTTSWASISQEWEFAKIEKILAGGAMAVD